jgi:hypothetical protein
MAIQYTYTRQTTQGDENIIVITVTNGSGAAWGSYFLAANYSYISGTSTSYYMTEQSGTGLASGSAIDIPLPISTATFASGDASNLLVGVSFPAHVTAIT